MNKSIERDLDNWLGKVYHPFYNYEREMMKKKIVRLVEEHPDLIENDWSELRMLIES